jgi:hypothetical protein
MPRAARRKGLWEGQLLMSALGLRVGQSSMPALPLIALRALLPVNGAKGLAATPAPLLQR